MTKKDLSSQMTKIPIQLKILQVTQVPRSFSLCDLLNLNVFYTPYVFTFPVSPLTYVFIQI